MHKQQLIDHTPALMRIVDKYQDGEDLCHFTFAPFNEGESLNKDEMPDLCNINKVQPGQFMMLTIPNAGEAAFTYASMPDENGHFHCLIRKIGELTDALFELEPGAMVGGRGPMGQGWPNLKDKKVLVIAGGCGLAPVAAKVDALIEASAEPVVYFSARNEAMLVMKQERERWQKQCKLYEAVDDCSGASKSYLAGRQLADNLDQIIQNDGPFDHVITCGPEGMMLAVCRIMEGKGFPADHIWLSLERRMHCGVGLCGHCYMADHLVCVDGPTYRWDQLGELVVKEKAIRPPESPLDMGHAASNCGEEKEGCDGDGGCGCR